VVKDILAQISEIDLHSAQKLSEKYVGKLPADAASELQNYVTKSREEWQQQIL